MQNTKIKKVKMLLSVYQNMYEQRNLLPDVGAYLDYDAEVLTPETVDSDTLSALETRAGKVASYLMGTRDIFDEDIGSLITLVKDNYQDQDFWRELLFDFIEYMILRERVALLAEEEALLEESKQLMLEIYQHEKIEKTVVEAFASKIKKAGFRVDAEKLVKNYLKMKKQDAKQAWEVLTTNPAFFSPIIVKDAMGGVVVSKEDAINENKKLAKFLKGLKA